MDRIPAGSGQIPRPAPVLSERRSLAGLAKYSAAHASRHAAWIPRDSAAGRAALSRSCWRRSRISSPAASASPDFMGGSTPRRPPASRHSASSGDRPLRAAADLRADEGGLAAGGQRSSAESGSKRPEPEPTEDVNGGAAPGVGVINRRRLQRFPNARRRRQPRHGQSRRTRPESDCPRCRPETFRPRSPERRRSGLSQQRDHRSRQCSRCRQGPHQECRRSRRQARRRLAGISATCSRRRRSSHEAAPRRG